MAVGEVLVVNCETGEETWRPMTADETAAQVTAVPEAPPQTVDLPALAQALADSPVFDQTTRDAIQAAITGLD